MFCELLGCLLVAIPIFCLVGVLNVWVWYLGYLFDAC